jgi:hypothetical protein
LLLQWEGGETRFGGPLRGPADGPLNIASSQDLSLGGHGALMIGPKEAAHLVVDENEIMANTGADSANLYLQWQGGETHFGGPVCGPDDGPLTVSGEQQATLQADSGSLMVGQLVGQQDGALGLSSTDLAVLAIAALKEQQLTIDRLERTVAALSADDD